MSNVTRPVISTIIEIDPQKRIHRFLIIVGYATGLLIRLRTEPVSPEILHHLAMFFTDDLATSCSPKMFWFVWQPGLGQRGARERSREVYDPGEDLSRGPHRKEPVATPGRYPLSSQSNGLNSTRWLSTR